MTSNRPNINLPTKNSSIDNKYFDPMKHKDANIINKLFKCNAAPFLPIVSIFGNNQKIDITEAKIGKLAIIESIIE
jgi:hypothetical protein